MDDNTDPEVGPKRDRPWTVALLVVIATAAVVIAILLAVDAFGDDDATSPSTTPVVTVPAPSTTTTQATTTPSTTIPAPTTAPATTVPGTTTPPTTSPAPTTAPATTTPPTTAPPIDEVRGAIFPTPGMGTIYTDPVTAAREFALAIGYADPVTGEFQAGDQRSGEVEVRAAPSSLTSVILVRQFDDAWYVIGAATENVEVDTPEPLEVIASPLVVTGRARSFEGTVDVVLTADDVDDPLVDDFVTGSGGPDLGPFEGTFEFDPPAVEGGALLFLSRSSEDGSVVEVGAQRVFFATE